MENAFAQELVQRRRILQAWVQIILQRNPNSLRYNEARCAALQRVHKTIVERRAACSAAGHTNQYSETNSQNVFAEC